MIDLSDRCLLRLSGPDRVRYLNGQVTNDVAKLEPGVAMHACVTDLKGRLEAEIFLRLLGGDPGQENADSILIDGPPGLGETLHARLDRYIIADDCELEDVSERFAIFHAPEAGTAPDLSAVPHHSFVASRLGREGRDFLLRREHVSALRDACEGPHPRIDEGELLPIRIRRKVPTWGRELTPGILPAEAGLDETAIDFHKGCYIGQEVISRIKSVGRVNRSLQVLAALDETADAWTAGTCLEQEEIEIRSGDEDSTVIGKVTSIAADPASGTVVALGFVKRGYEEPGTRVLLRREGENILSCPFEIRNTAEN